MTASSATYQRLPEDERRQLLIDATIACLSEHGLQGTTVRKIAAKASVTPGLVTHYFHGKDALVSAAYRYLAEKYHYDYVATAEAAGDDPVEKLKAFMSAVFSPDTLDKELLSVWTSFWTSILTDGRSEPAAVHLETAGLTRDYLRQLLRDVFSSHGQEIEEPVVNDLSIAIMSFMDGMWLSWGLNPALFDAKSGRRILTDMVGARLHFVEFNS